MPISSITGQLVTTCNTVWREMFMNLPNHENIDKLNAHQMAPPVEHVNDITIEYHFSFVHSCTCALCKVFLQQLEDSSSYIHTV